MNSLKLKHNVMCIWEGQKAFYIEHLERSNLLNSSKMAEFSQVILLFLLLQVWGEKIKSAVARPYLSRASRVHFPVLSVGLVRTYRTAGSLSVFVEWSEA